MKVLITGGAGFIGSHLSEQLLAQGHEVTVLDDLSTGSIANITHLKQNRKFSYFIDTVFNAPIVSELVDASDFVYHLAAAVGVRLIINSPVRTIETNVHGTEVVLKAAAKKQRPIVIASTSEVYGKSTAIPFREDADLVMGATHLGRWSYACSKALDEFLGIAYWTEKRVPVIIVRLFNTVGPRQTGRYGMVLPTLVRQALENQPMTVFGTGEQSRCFGSVYDVVRILMRMPFTPQLAGEVINVGNDSEITINALAHLIRDITGSQSEIVHVPYGSAYGVGFEDMMRRVPSLEKLERLLGMRPTATVETIVQNVVADVRATMDRQEEVAVSVYR